MKLPTVLFQVNEEFHPARSGLRGNCSKRRLEVNKIIYAISDSAIPFKVGEQTLLTTHVKEVESILSLFQSLIVKYLQIKFYENLIFANITLLPTTLKEAKKLFWLVSSLQ